MRHQPKTGATGPRGPKGARGTTGLRGQIGKRGPKGLKGVKGPIHKSDVLDLVVRHFDDVYRQLNEQAARIARLQRQVDEMIATLRQEQ